MSKQFLAIIAVVILVFIGIFAFSGKNNSSSTSSSGTPSQHVEGKDADHITLTEYGDYQCPYCGQYYPIVKQVVAEYSNQISFQFRNFPLTSLHPNAFAGARAAEAASLQGKFWQMHDLLYEQNDNYYDSNETVSTWINASNPQTYFDQYASELGLNVSKFNTDYASDQVNNTINADMSAGNKLNITGTPTFFLNGKQVQFAESVSSFQQYINAAIAKSTAANSKTSS